MIWEVEVGHLRERLPSLLFEPLALGNSSREERLQLRALGVALATLTVQLREEQIAARWISEVALVARALQ